MDRHRIVQDALVQPPEAIRRALTTAIREADPELYVVEKSVQNGKLRGNPTTAWWMIEWQGSRMESVQIELDEGFRRTAYTVLMGKSPEAVDGYLVALERFSSEIEGAVLVFQDGCWRYDEELYDDIRSSTFETLVLPPGLADTIQSDVRQWLDSRALYEEHGVPWKRGMILVGPPGNGKTHLIKALVNRFDLSALYVRGFTAEHKTDAQNISAVFQRARACAPAILIFEDVDTLVNPGNRSHFLNELDGFARNTGILAVASANDPAKLDPALVNRPSRFDRRYVFALPELAERGRYLQFFTATLRLTLRLSDAEAAEIGAAAEGFSYAYLKELVLSGMMAWISAGGTEPFVGVLRREIVPLQTQMAIDPEPTPTAIDTPKTPRYGRRS